MSITFEQWRKMMQLCTFKSKRLCAEMQAELRSRYPDYATMLDWKEAMS